MAGDGATAFAELMGFKRQSLETNTSTSEFKSWKKDNCQPNYYNVSPTPIWPIIGQTKEEYNTRIDPKKKEEKEKRERKYKGYGR